MAVRIGFSLRLACFFQAEDGIRDGRVTGVQTCALPISVGSGGANGLGFGLSKQKLSFLPAPQSDYIFAVISEELGMAGAVTLVLVFGFFLWRRSEERRVGKECRARRAP